MNFSVPANKTSANRCRGASFDTSELYIRSELSSSLHNERELYSCGVHSIQCLRQQQATNIWVLGREDPQSETNVLRHFCKSDVFKPRSVLPLIKETPFTSKVTPSPESMLKRALAALPRGYNIGTGGGERGEGRNVRSVGWANYTWREKVCFREVSQLLLSLIAGKNLALPHTSNVMYCT